MSEQEKPRLPDSRSTTEGPVLGGKLALGRPSGQDDDAAVSFFRQVPLFSLLSSKQVMEVMRVCSIVTYAAGQMLFREDEAADAMYIIERGEVSITRRSLGGEDVRVAYVGDGSVIGEMALIVSAPRSASVEAVSETRVYRLDGRDFDSLRRQRSLAAYKILLKLLETMGDRRHRVLERIDDIFAKPGEHVESFRRQAGELVERVNKARQLQEGEV